VGHIPVPGAANIVKLKAAGSGAIILRAILAADR
jgi:hypothetical protein